MKYGSILLLIVIYNIKIMKIIELKSSNIKKIKAVELQLDKDKNVVMITGKNGQGKTSILDSIWYALGGKNAVQDKPIRDGEETGEIEIDVGGYIVKRTFTDKSSYLTVTNKEGAKYSNPQEFLNYIMGNLSFDPLEFSRFDNKKQIEELTKIVGIDLNVYDKKKKDLTEERVIIGREQKALPKYTEAEIAEAEKLKDKQEISIAEISREVEKENIKHGKFITAKDFIARLKLDNESAKATIVQLQEKIKENDKQIEENSKIEDTKVDIEALKNQIAGAETDNAKIRQAKTIIEANNKAIAKKKEYDELTAKIVGIDNTKKAQLASAKMPIEGLSWEEDKVIYNKIPYDQISAAEQLRVSMAIAMASNPKLKVILIRDGSLLDKDNLKVVEEMAKDKDFQVWIESVDDSGKVGIYIEDGEIKKIN